MTLLDDELARAGGVLRCRDHPHLRSAISRAVAANYLARPLPGVVVLSSMAEEPLTRIRAAATWHPEFALSLDAAAHLTITPRASLPQIVLAGGSGRAYPGYLTQHREIQPQLLLRRAGLLMTGPSLTVADLLTIGRTSDLYDALRRRLVTQESVRAALDATPHRRGTALARHLLWLARENPWSDGEALMHSLFRTHGLRGWKGNLQVVVGGQIFYGDAVFRRSRLVVELDGREHHTSERDRLADHARRNLLTAAGWRVLVITMDMLLSTPDQTMALIRRSLKRVHETERSVNPRHWSVPQQGGVDAADRLTRA